MKLLISIADASLLTPAFQAHGIAIPVDAPKYAHCTYNILQHEVDVLSAGNLSFDTSYAITKLLTANKYHLALHLSFSGAWKPEHAPGTILNIINEKPGDIGEFTDGRWTDSYEAELLVRENPPHIRGGFINLTNAYMNVFAPYKKAVGITVNQRNASPDIRQHTLKADCETTNGLAFSFVCLAEKQAFYHLSVIERNYITGETGRQFALQSLNNTVAEILSKL